MPKWIYGCPARFFNRYLSEVGFARQEGFAFQQLWYDAEGLKLHEEDSPALQTLLESPFPAIIHAMLDVEDLPAHALKLRGCLRALGHQELIVHPVSKRLPFSESVNVLLAERLGELHALLSLDGVRIFVENNSRLDPLFSRPRDLETVFGRVSGLGFLLDVAHPSSFEELRDWARFGSPDMLHVADRRHAVVHEHLPIGTGELDFEAIFSGPLKGFSGKMIFEIVQSDEALRAAIAGFQALERKIYG